MITRAPAIHRASAFTLVELLIIIGIICLLVAMLMPSLSRVRTLAQRASCESNVRDIAKGVSLYCLDGAWHRGTTAGAIPMAQLPTASVNTNATQSLWLLATGAPSGGGGKTSWTTLAVFVCPESRKNKPVVGDGAFKDDTLSYGYQSLAATVPVTSGGPSVLTSYQSSGSVVVVADRNPHFTFAGGPDSGGGMVNSTNHHGEGQSVGRLDGSAAWLTTPTTDGGTDPARNNIYLPEGSGTASSANPATVEDTVIVP